jgi:hypothetical protein
MRSVEASRSARLLSVADRMCKPECMTAIAGKPLYLDDDHLSRFGAVTFIAPLLAETVFAKDH